MINSKDLNFSFSGLKTAVLYTVQKIENLTEEIKSEISAEFENSVVETIIKKTRDAISNFDAKTIILGGGVAANKTLRESLKRLAEEENCQIFIPEINHSTDNALMISVAGALRIAKDNLPKEKLESVNKKETTEIKDEKTIEAKKEEQAEIAKAETKKAKAK
jgi:N6-L-threonylcarbamoyladenine synthase